MASKSSGREGGKNRQDKFLLQVGGAGLALLVVIVGVGLIWARITSSPSFKVRPIAMTFPKGTWLKPEAARQDFIRAERARVGDPAACILDKEVSLFSRGLCNRVAGAYACSPWVARVNHVRKLFPNRLDVSLELREPFAVIQSSRGAYVVDQDGHALDGNIYDLRPERLAALTPRAAVPANVPGPFVGVKWDDPAIEGAIEMVRLCRQHFPREVAAVNIRTFGSSEGIVYVDADLTLAKGTVIQWGRALASQTPPGQPTADQKSAQLRAILRREGPNLLALRRIDLTTEIPRVQR